MSTNFLDKIPSHTTSCYAHISELCKKFVTGKHMCYPQADWTYVAQTIWKRYVGAIESLYYALLRSDWTDARSAILVLFYNMMGFKKSSSRDTTYYDYESLVFFVSEITKGPIPAIDVETDFRQSLVYVVNAARTIIQLTQLVSPFEKNSSGKEIMKKNNWFYKNIEPGRFMFAPTEYDEDYDEGHDIIDVRKQPGRRLEHFLDFLSLFEKQTFGDQVVVFCIGCAVCSAKPTDIEANVKILCKVVHACCLKWFRKPHYRDPDYKAFAGIVPPEKWLSTPELSVDASDLLVSFYSVRYYNIYKKAKCRLSLGKIMAAFLAELNRDPSVQKECLHKLTNEIYREMLNMRWFVKAECCPRPRKTGSQCSGYFVGETPYEDCPIYQNMDLDLAEFVHAIYAEGLQLDHKALQRAFQNYYASTAIALIEHNFTVTEEIEEKIFNPLYYTVYQLDKKHFNERLLAKCMVQCAPYTNVFLMPCFVKLYPSTPSSMAYVNICCLSETYVAAIQSFGFELTPEHQYSVLQKKLEMMPRRFRGSDKFKNWYYTLTKALDNPNGCLRWCAPI